AALNGFTFRGDSVAKTNSYAAFGQTTFHITPEWSLTTGLRYTKEKKRGDFTQRQVGGVDLATVPAAVATAAQALRNTYGPASSYVANTDESNLSGQANLAWKPSADLLVYATYARGYKSGGLNLANLPAGAKSTVNPEKVVSYETGLKSQFLDRRLTANATAFLTYVSDYQSINSVPGLSLVYLANAAKVRSRGAEVELQANPLEGLSLNAGATYAETVYADYANAPCAVGRTAPCSLSGVRLPNAPLWSTSFSGEYARPVAAFGGGAQAYVSADVSWRSDYNSASDNSPFGNVKGYEITNLRVGLRHGDGTWDAYVWARNLFNEDYLQRIQLAGFNSGLLVASVGDPRTIGVTLRARR
ncbi:MAG: Pesticin receptor, partial [Caulobacteraceae bacterium]|nr:Pesticin receptor [Caulobacteraceae bacterium]